MGKRKRGRKNPETIGVNLGELLTEKLKELHVTNAELGRRMDRPPSAAYPWRRQPSVQAYVLWEISIALKYDFFSALSMALQEKYPDVISAFAKDKETIDSLQKELAAVKEERDYLKKMIDIFAMKK
jgi:transposase-like protein